MLKKIIFSKRGFTLVELLVVIAIIGVLSTLAFTTFKGAQLKSRDAKRLSDLNAVRSALDMYYSYNRHYPTFITALEPIKNDSGKVYLDSMPTNPFPRTDHGCADSDYVYTPGPDNKTYSLTSCVGNSNENLPKTVSAMNSGLFNCGDIVTDRDDYEYPSVQVGTQCWLGQNLRTKTGPDGQLLTMGTATSQRDCITTSNTRGTEADCQARGALYNLATAKTICPVGWHLPTDLELRPIESYLTDSGNTCVGNRGYWGMQCGDMSSPAGCLNAGQKLKEGGSSNFEWKLTGRRTVNSSLVSSFTGAGTTGYTWSQTTYTCFANGMPGPQPYNYIAIRSVSNSSAAVTRETIPLNFWNLFGGTEVVYTDYQALPVRCIKD